MNRNESAALLTLLYTQALSIMYLASLDGQVASTVAGTPTDIGITFALVSINLGLLLFLGVKLYRHHARLQVARALQRVPAIAEKDATVHPQPRRSIWQQITRRLRRPQAQRIAEPPRVLDSDLLSRSRAARVSIFQNPLAMQPSHAPARE